MIRKILFILLVLISGFFQVFAQDETAHPLLTYSEAFGRIKSDSSEYKIAEIKKRISMREAETQVTSGIIPSFTVSSTLVNGTGILSPSSNQNTGWNWNKSIGLGINGKLTVGSSNVTSLMIGGIQKAIAEFTNEQTVYGLEKTLFSLYWGLSAAEHAIAVGEETVKIAKESLENLQTKYDSGLASSLEFMNAKLAKANAETTLLNLRKSRVDAYLLLKAMLNTDNDFVVEDMFSPQFVDFPSSEYMFPKYISTNSTMKKLFLEYAATKAGHDAMNYAYKTPSLSLNFSYGYGGNYESAAGTKDVMTFSIAAGLSLDGFIPGTSAYKSIADAKDNTEISKINLEKGFKTYKQELESSINNIVILENKYVSSKLQAEYAQEALRLSKDAFDNGKITAQEYSSALNTNISAQTAMLSSALEYQTAVYAFSVYLGQDYDEFINEYKRNS